MPDRFSRDNAFGKTLLDWWQQLDDDRASRATLRRAPTVTAVTLSAPYQRLFRRLRAIGWNADDVAWRNDRLAAIVGLLAHVSEDRQGELAKAMSHKTTGEDRPMVSELRFTRLLESPDGDSLFVGLRRVLPLMSNSVDVVALANDILHWGDKVKKGWAYSYDWPAHSND
ncbi:MAG: type I-E CRISPR-associated protein Cse2/CasB [Thauera sp.]|nr:type I-E CRISPR-associated protein Cse2/CasB [Thauera sp.]